MSDKDLNLAIASFNDCRAEIRDRIGLRDQWISRYVFGVVAFLGAAVGIEILDFDNKIILCLVMPVISLIVAINVSEHVRRVEKLANFLRGVVNDFLIIKDAWAPHWDWKTATDPNYNRRFTHVVSLHLPSIVSLVFAAIYIRKNYRFCQCFSLPPLAPALFSIACVMVAVAIGVTLKAFDGRFNHPLPSHTPPIYTLKGEYLILATPAGTRAVPEPTPITRAPSPRPKRPRKSAPPPP